MSTHLITLVVDNGQHAGNLRGKECRNSERSGHRTRQSRGFFVPGIRLSTAGRATDTTPRKGEEVQRLRSLTNLPATSPVRVVTPLRGFIELTQESFRMHQLAHGAAAPVVSLIDGRAVTTSLEVARIFGKRHDRVLEAIRNLLTVLPPDHVPNFREMTHSVAIGKGGTRQDPAYHITRDGFTLLAMGFTGKKALTFKLAYIAAFNRMEAELAEHRIAQAGRSPLQGRWCLNFESPSEPVRLTRIPDSMVIFNPKDAKDLEQIIQWCVPPELLPHVMELALKQMRLAMGVPTKVPA